MVTCEQTALLYDIYRKQSTQLEQEDSHLFLRFIPLSSSQTNANKTLDELVQEARDPKNDAFDGCVLKYISKDFIALPFKLND